MLEQVYNKVGKTQEATHYKRIIHSHKYLCTVVGMSIHHLDPSKAFDKIKR